MASASRWIILVFIGFVVYFAPAQCRRARHASWRSGQTGVSRCARCPPGWGVERRCQDGLPGLDTACTPCRAGETFSAHHSARSTCLMCSRCGEGLFTAKECTATRDTHCAACDPPPPPHRRNQDYHRRCTVRQDPQDADDDGMLSDAPVEQVHEVREQGQPLGPLGQFGVSLGLSQSTLLPVRSKSDMARSILADPGLPRVSRLPHVLLADDDKTPKEEYSLLQHQQSHAGPAYSVLTDDGPVAPAAPEPSALHRPVSPRPPPPRYPVRLSSPIAWGRPSAPSVNTRHGPTTPRGKALGDLSLSLPSLHRHEVHPTGTDDGDMDAEEVGRLML